MVVPGAECKDASLSLRVLSNMEREQMSIHHPHNTGNIPT